MGTQKKVTKKRKRLDSTLESRGAEILVLGQLLTEGIQAFKAYKNFPGYDVIATNPKKNTSCRVQVKSRWATDYDGGFLIKNFDCDFVVHVALNRGYSRPKVKAKDNGRRAPEFYVLPVDIVKKAKYAKSSLGKVRMKQIKDVEQYRDNWNLIAKFLK